MPLHTVTATTLHQWLKAGEAMLVDVREPAEYQAEHIEGSVSTPLSTLQGDTPPNYSGKKLVVHCRKGGRGTTACEAWLKKDPLLDIYNLEGGINAWIEAGYAVKRSGGFCLPLDRQVQLTIGLCVLSASILGYMVDSRFFWLSGFFGAGLTFAGLTGFCGLAIVMAKMPWNQATTKERSHTGSCCATKAGAH